MHSKQPLSVSVGGNPPALCFCKVEVPENPVRGLQNQVYVCLAQLLTPYPVGPRQPPRMTDTVFALQKTCQCMFLLNCKHLAPEIWLRDWGTELYNHSLISNFISIQQKHRPNKLFLHFCSQTLWATFPLVFRERAISSCLKCAAKMHLMYCTYGTKTGKKEATTPPEQLENTPRFSRKQNVAFEFFLSGRRKLQITHRRDAIFLWAVVYNSLRLSFFLVVFSWDEPPHWLQLELHVWRKDRMSKQQEIRQVGLIKLSLSFAAPACLSVSWSRSRSQEELFLALPYGLP